MRVLLIVGMHPHRLQGFVEHKGKRAYMSLGNFLFPNFYMVPPAQIHYPEQKKLKTRTTRQYHLVHDVTYKKWRLANRVSIVLTFDIQKNTIEHHFTIQDDNIPRVTDVKCFFRVFLNLFVFALSKIYRLPRVLYVPLEKVASFFSKEFWLVGIYWFKFRQLGVREFFSKMLCKYKSS